MAIDDDGMRTPSTGRQEVDAPESPQAVSERSKGRTGAVLGGLLALLLIAGAVYYFTGDRAGLEVATGPEVKQPESATPAVQPRATESTGQQAAPAASPQPPAPPPQAPTATTPQTAPNNAQADQAPAAPSAVTPRAPPAAPARTATNDPPPAQPPAAPQQSMRDQPAALPDQPAAARKVEVTLVVKRGPANIRSAPGRNGRVTGTAARDARVKEISRSGSWIEVETESGRGWISSTLLGPLPPESR